MTSLDNAFTVIAAFEVSSGCQDREPGKQLFHGFEQCNTIYETLNVV